MLRADLELGFFTITSLFITDLLLMYIVYTNVCRSEGKLAYLAAFTSNILGCVTKTCQKFSVLQFAGETDGLS